MSDQLAKIGFYTLCDKRAKEISATSPMWRTEMILTPKCNFHCGYCRGPRSDWNTEMPLEKAKDIVYHWSKDSLKNIRFSGGEPTIYPGILELVEYAKDRGVERIAISTNGSADTEFYDKLVAAGVNDFSVSLDACCANFGDDMAGVKGYFNKIVANIKHLSKKTYVTVGVVLTEKNVGELKKIVEFAHNLGVADIRIISAAQWNKMLEGVKDISDDILNAHPILKYRVENIRKGKNVRGIQESDCHQCHLVKDDSVVAGDFHFPCVIYLREHGDPIGKIGSDMRKERVKWSEKHDCFADKICRENCLDVCQDFNLRCEEFLNKE
jgi:MoaA/NifB/PqqE/SkfB family radical SAM enzyme